MSVKAKNINSINTGILMVLFYSVTAFASDYTVIANKGVAATSLTKQDLQAIFTAEKTRWDDGKPINVVILSSGDESRFFLQKIVGKTPTQYQIFWKKLVFTGRAAPPVSFEEPASVVRHVARTSGAIGFISPSDVTAAVKTLSVK